MCAISGDAIAAAFKTVKERIPGVAFKLDEPLRNHTSFKIGGPVRVMYFPESIECVKALCGLLDKHNVTPFVLGNGTNILASDTIHNLVVINMSRLCAIRLIERGNEPYDCRNGHESCPPAWIPACKDDRRPHLLYVEAGALLSKTAVFACENGLSGLEFAHGIPGAIGGAVVMNAGAYGGEMKDVVHSTTAYNAKTGIFTLAHSDQEFSYRHSRFSNSDDVVLSTVIRLRQGEKKNIRKTMDDLCVRRHKSQPLEFPSGGSIFKRPKEGYAAAFVEQAGLRGYTVGKAQVSEKHTGFVVNRGGATFTDTIEVIKHVQETVYAKFGTLLELEIKVLN